MTLTSSESLAQEPAVGPDQVPSRRPYCVSVSGFGVASYREALKVLLCAWRLSFRMIRENILLLTNGGHP